MMRVHFILNPKAGNGRGKKRWLQFDQQLSFPYELHETQYAGHAYLLARDIAKRATNELPNCIVAIGGDGTVHEVLNGAANNENVYIGAIAAGSGNDFSRAIQLLRMLGNSNSLLPNWKRPRMIMALHKLMASLKYSLIILG